MQTWLRLSFGLFSVELYCLYAYGTVEIHDSLPRKLPLAVIPQLTIVLFYCTGSSPDSIHLRSFHGKILPTTLPWIRAMGNGPK